MIVTNSFSTFAKGKVKVFLSKLTTRLGKIGKALLFPIAALPMAAILLRIGAQLPSDTAFASFIRGVMLAGGNVVFDNLPILFAIGVAFGFTKDNRGEAAFAGFIGMVLLKLLMSSSGADLAHKIYGSVHNFHVDFGGKYDAILSDNVLNGVIAGLIVAAIYNKFRNVELPNVLGFFSGRRLIPVLTIAIMIVFGIFYSIIFPWVGWLLNKFSIVLGEATGNRWANAGIMGIYGVINRFLIPFGMHHIPNTLFWFTLGEHTDIQGNVVNGDINIFLSGIAEGNTSGTFQSGFFPTMMFGLPALAYAFYSTAEDKDQKRKVLAIFGSAAAVSFLTGITEPIEFAFLFLSPLLFVGHACLTGIFAFITGIFGVQLGFGFSAGFLDYVLSIPKSMDIINANRTGIDAVMANPGWIWLIGTCCAASYFFGARFLITKFNLSTPGRGEGRIEAEISTTLDTPSHLKFSAKAKAIVRALGGWNNITSYQNCATRLRYDVKDASQIDKVLLKKAGTMGVVIPSKTHVQIVIGPQVEILNNEIIDNKGQSLD